MSKLTLTDDAWTEDNLIRCAKKLSFFFLWRCCLECDVVGGNVCKGYFDISPL